MLAYEFSQTDFSGEVQSSYFPPDLEEFSSNMSFGRCQISLTHRSSRFALLLNRLSRQLRLSPERNTCVNALAGRLLTFTSSRIGTGGLLDSLARALVRTLARVLTAATVLRVLSPTER